MRKVNALLLFFSCIMLSTFSLPAQTVRDHRYDGKWKLLQSVDAKDVTVNDKGEMYMVSTSGQLYKHNGTYWSVFDQERVTCYAECSMMGVIIHTNGYTSMKNVSIDQTTGQPKFKWELLKGRDAVDLTITSYIPPNSVSGRRKMMMVNTDGKIYLYSDNSTKWVQVPGSDGARISAGNGDIWLVNTVGKIYRFIYSDRTNTPYRWEQMPGNNARDIAVAVNGDKWITTTDGKVHKWNGTSWSEIVGITGAQRIAVNKGKVLVIKKDHKIYQLDY
jgi:hypothetical protein